MKTKKKWKETVHKTIISSSELLRERVFPTSFYLWNIRHSWRQTRLCTNKIIIFKKKWFVFNFAFISNSSDSFTNSVTTNLRIFSTKMNVMYRKLVKPSDEFNSTYELFTKCFHENRILKNLVYFLTNRNVLGTKSNNRQTTNKTSKFGIRFSWKH